MDAGKGAEVSVGKDKGKQAGKGKDKADSEGAGRAAQAPVKRPVVQAKMAAFFSKAPLIVNKTSHLGSLERPSVTS